MAGLRIMRTPVNWGFPPFSRNMSFKVLSSEFTLKEPELSAVNKKSKETKKAVDLLSKFALSGGGKKSIHRHTIVNKKVFVRDRLKMLLDNDSPFLEIGLFAGIGMDYGSIPAAGAVAGIGKIHGHFCIVVANDATIKGGAIFPITLQKKYRVQQLSLVNRLPCIYLVDSAGAFLPLQSEIFPDRNHGGRTFYNEAIFSSYGIPQIAIVCGSCTAGGAYCPTMAEEAIIIKDSGTIFLGGPPLVKAATGEIVTEQDLGGALMHCSVSGCTDYFAGNEEEAFEMCRESVLTFNFSPNEKEIPYEEPLHSANDLLLLSGKEHLNKEDMYMVISRILDGSRFKEFKSKFGENLITGFGFIHGILVGVVANCGPLAFQDAQKGAHLIELCEKRSIPLCFLQNSGSIEKDIGDRNQDSLKDKAKMVVFHSSVNVPKVAVCIGGCYEDDNFTMCGRAFEPNFLFSWPLAHTSSSRYIMQEVKSSESDILDKLSNTQELSEYEMLFHDKTSAFHQSSRMLNDGVISPENTRQILGLCLEVVSTSKLRNSKSKFR